MRRSQHGGDVNGRDRKEGVTAGEDWEQVGEVFLKKDVAARLVRVRLPDGREGSIAGATFGALLEEIGKPCLACGVGTIEIVDFTDFPELRLACDECGTCHMLYGGQLMVEFGGSISECSES